MPENPGLSRPGRLIAAMLVAPAIGMVLLWTLLFASSWIEPDEKPQALGEMLRASVAIAVISAPVLYPLAWLFGLPTHLVLAARGMTGYRHYGLVGLILGMAAALLMLMLGLRIEATIGVLVAPLVALVGRAIVGGGHIEAEQPARERD